MKKWKKSRIIMALTLCAVTAVSVMSIGLASWQTTITGSGSAVVRSLPCRSYIVEQVNGWSWRYGDAPQTIGVTEAGASVTFSGTAVQDKWLSGSSEAVRNRKG